MQTIGLIGGMSWESTIPYYRIINEYVRGELGGLHSAKIVLASVEFDEIERCQSCGDWEKAGQILADAAKGLEVAGADFILICTNTMHKVFEQVQAAVSVPLLHIALATGDVLKNQGIQKVGLLGTKYTMTQDFYKGTLAQAGFEVLVPASEEDIQLVNRVIFEELCLGQIRPDSKAEFLRIIRELAGRGAEGVILGCTEIGLLVGQADTDVPLFDTTEIHAKEAARRALTL